MSNTFQNNPLIKKGKNILQEIVEFNKTEYPEPSFYNHVKIIKHYGKSLNWKRIKDWTQMGAIRTLKIQVLVGNNLKYDYRKPSHKNKPTHFINYYAQEDFKTLLDPQDSMKTSTKLSLIQYNKEIGGINYLVRDFTKTSPELAQIRAMTDMLTGLVGGLVKQKFLSAFEDLTELQYDRMLRDMVAEIKQLS